MTRKILLAIAVAAVAAVGCRQKNRMAEMIDSVAKLSAEQCLIMGGNLDSLTMPRTVKDGEFVSSNLKHWCSGFFPGTCWYSYMLSGNEEVLELAKAQTDKLLDPDSYYTHHDIGFQLMSSAALAWKNTGDEKYLPAIRRGAELLASRFSPAVGLTMSWDAPKYSYPVIIDNMMNLELLTFAARQFDVPEWRDMALSHADKTLANHFREDNSSYHMVEYDEETGEPVCKHTVQGWSDDSAWSRGQSWGLYGFTMMYRETGEERYLEQAEKIAEFLLPLLAERPVPAWDFNAPEPESLQADASAGAVMASAFIELSTLTKDADLAKRCLSQAEATLLELASPEYLAEKGELFGFILKHSTGHYTKGSEVDAPLTYADYYFLEALYRYKNLK